MLLPFIVSLWCFLSSPVYASASGNENDVKATCLPITATSNNTEDLIDLITKWNNEIDFLQTDSIRAAWNWQVNLTDENANASNEINIKTATAGKRIWKEARCLEDCTNCHPEWRRQLSLYQSAIGVAALNEKQLSEFQPISQKMKSIYSTAKVCNLSDSFQYCLSLDPELTSIMREQGDYCQLARAWKKWRDVSGKNMRDLFVKYCEFVNTAALYNDFKNGQEMWLSEYVRDSPEFLNDIFALWEEVKPLYQELHAFARSQLVRLYGNDKFPKSGHIPAHLLGNMWAQDWSSLLNIMLPEVMENQINITKNLLAQDFTVHKLFVTADKFFQSLGMNPMTDDFWRNSVFTKRTDADMVCHASAWDMNNNNDFRIKMCTSVDATDFQTVHHEMGHIQYFMHYHSLPLQFRDAANPGFHEAIGDLIAISAMNPLHLKAIGILSEKELNSENEDAVLLNGLMLRALGKVAFLPFGLLVDLYRYAVFNGTIAKNHLNAGWWNLRCSLQGVSPPSIRSEEDFDPGSKYHIAADSAYINYFVAALLQFDFHENICRRMGYTKDFHKCDIWGHAEAAQTLREIMSLGRSKPHPEILKVITGGRDRMSAAPLLRFFKPLHDWLTERNSKTGTTVGWDESSCPLPTFEC